MQFSKLIHDTLLFAPVDALSAKGDQTVSYPSGVQMFASIEPLTGRELNYAQQMRADVTHKITMRYLTGVSHRYRITWNSRTFELGPPLTPEERNELMVFTAIEVK